MKTLIYTTAVNTNDRAINDMDIFDIVKQSWEHYCKRHEIDFYVIDEPQLENIMTRWDAPNIFEYCDENDICAVHDNSGLSWIWEGINGYQSMFPDVKLEWDTYFNSGVLVFSSKHEQIIRDFKQFYIDNQTVIEDYRNRLRKGFDQTIFNYFLKWYGQPITLISEKWNLFHMIRREILYNGYFIDMGYFWHYNGLDRKTQVDSIQQIWNQIKENYEN